LGWVISKCDCQCQQTGVVAGQQTRIVAGFSIPTSGFREGKKRL